MSAELIILGVGVFSVLALSKRATSALGTGEPAAGQASPPLPAAPKIDDWTRYDASFQAVASWYPYPWQWLKALALCETLLGTDATYIARGKGSSDGKSWGLMQLTPATAGDMAGVLISVDELQDDNTSIELAAKYVNWLFERYSGDTRKTIMSYNQGPGNTDKGADYAADYFDRWQRWLTKVNSGVEYL